jgi:HEAT repeat protein
MIVKTPVLPHRVRKVPKSFSWIDHRLIRKKYLDRISHPAAALYLFLVCVGDDKGLSYYGDKSIMKTLSMELRALQGARRELIRTGLIAWQPPIYQVLCLAPANNKVNRDQSLPTHLGEIFKNAMEGAK